MIYKCKLKLIESGCLGGIWDCDVRLDYKRKGNLFYKSKYILTSSASDIKFLDNDDYTTVYEYFNDRLNSLLELGEEGIMKLCREAIIKDEGRLTKEINAEDKYIDNKIAIKKLFKSFELEVK